MRKFLDVDKLSDSKLDELLERVQEIYLATVNDVLDRGSHTYQRVLKLNEDPDLDLLICAYSLDDLELDEFEDDLAEFYEEDYGTLFVAEIAYGPSDQKSGETIVAADILLSENTELNNYFVHWFPNEN